MAISVNTNRNSSRQAKTMMRCNSGGVTVLSFVLFPFRHPHLHRSIQHRSIQFQHQGNISVSVQARSKLSPSTYSIGERPPDPDSLISQTNIDESVSKLVNWFSDKSNVLCLTGAGISTGSGIPDYRGHGGSYHKGHKPIVHHQFMEYEKTRKRYWGRAMFGWRDFANASPNEGHFALRKLEEMGKIGVDFDDDPSYYNLEDEDASLRSAFSNGSQKLSIITQNVDGLHRKAGTKHMTELHGRGDVVKCMSCGTSQSRYDFHDELDKVNMDWKEKVIENADNNENQQRPDGDANISSNESYSDVIVPPCNHCNDGFVKPHVVFFGDTVPKNRVERCYAAVKASDGLLCIGSSLTVYSAFRFVQAAAKEGIPIAILNVGETRAETSDISCDKIEAPIGPTLTALVDELQRSRQP